jgi:RimJ/RimL family protein N-acetyltransferase
LATERIKAITLSGFNELKLGKIETGCYDNNKGSLRAFLKCGYQVEGHLRKNILFEGSRIGSFWLGVFPHEVT